MRCSSVRSGTTSAAPATPGYPVRAIRTPDYLYISNFTPDAWPAGNPQTGYRNVDDGATIARLARPV